MIPFIDSSTNLLVLSPIVAWLVLVLIQCWLLPESMRWQEISFFSMLLFFVTAVLTARLAPEVFSDLNWFITTESITPLSGVLLLGFTLCMAGAPVLIVALLFWLVGRCKPL